MDTIDRRSLIHAAVASGAAALFSGIAKAHAIPPATRTGTIEDVEHIVILMQENRSFDHYFGTMAGVQGFADPHPVPTRHGPIWNQANAAGEIFSPFRFDVEGTSFPVMKSLPHDFGTGFNAWNGGRSDNWIAAKGPLTMGFLAREDIPYHFALADAFTVCDAYFSSLRGPTCPNRFYLMTGGIDHSGLGGGPVIDCSNITQRPNGVIYRCGWTTYPERLQQAGVSWQVYAQGIDNSDDNSDGGMNVLLAFEQFRDAKPGDPLYERGVRPRRLEMLKRDVQQDRLPQVSWIIPPRLFCEHPNWPPAYGVEYLARVMDALTANPKVWAKTVFLVMYDENDGFFDHVPPPTPALLPEEGASTVPVADEFHPRTGQPYGLGNRVPMLAISPWSKGGWVCSEVFDHSSVIRFIEARFGVREPNISTWRRTVCGDLTSAFDFSAAERTVPRMKPAIGAATPLPTEAVFERFRSACNARPQPVATGKAAPPNVEAGTKPARPLAYDLRVEEERSPTGLRLRLRNQGDLGMAIQIYDRADEIRAPWRYTIGAGASLVADLPARGSHFWFALHGPAGLFREFRNG